MHARTHTHTIHTCVHMHTNTTHTHTHTHTHAQTHQHHGQKQIQEIRHGPAIRPYLKDKIQYACMYVCCTLTLLNTILTVPLSGSCIKPLEI